MIKVGAYYADVPGQPSRFDEYREYAQASRRALKATNPHAQYDILTDEATARKWILADFDVEIFRYPTMPLMLKIVASQLEYVRDRWNGEGLLVLPDIDCLANRDLSDAIPSDVGLAITHRGVKRDYRINNLAYIRNQEMASWFLGRALQILKTWRRDVQEWGGDQDAWSAACGIDFSGGSLVVLRHVIGDILVAEPNRGRQIFLYPCDTHNCTMSNDGRELPAQDSAYFVHFKGARKEHLRDWLARRFS